MMKRKDVELISVDAIVVIVGVISGILYFGWGVTLASIASAVILASIAITDFVKRRRSL